MTVGTWGISGTAESVDIMSKSGGLSNKMLRGAPTRLLSTQLRMLVVRPLSLSRRLEDAFLGILSDLQKSKDTDNGVCQRLPKPSLPIELSQQVSTTFSELPINFLLSNSKSQIFKDKQASEKNF